MHLGIKQRPSGASPAVTKSLYGVARTVVVNTRKYDIHRRYVAHVFYTFNNRGIDHTGTNRIHR